MKNLDLKTKTLTFNFNGVLSKRDEVILAGLGMTEQTAFIMSKLGIKIKDDEVRSKISSVREKLKDQNQSVKPLVRMSGNHFVNLLRNRFQIGFASPKDSAQYFGVEIECFIPFKALNMSYYDYERSGSSECSTCEGSGNITYVHRDSGHEYESECPDCNGSGECDNDDESGFDDDSAISDAKAFFKKKVTELKIKGLDVKHDGSLDADGDEETVLPIELTLLVRQDDLSDLEKLCKLLNDLGAYVNNSCGLHVHIDSRDKTKAQIQTIARRFEAALPFMTKLVPRSRRENRYCKAGVSTLNGDRYHAVNLTSFAKHGTIEVRLHSATTNFVKIKNWLKIVSAVYSNRKSTDLRNWQDFEEFIGADQELCDYMKARRMLFNPKASIGEDQSGDEPNCQAS